MNKIIGIVFIALLIPMAAQGNDRYQEMKKWLRAHEAEERQAEKDEAKAEKERLKKIQNCARAKDYAERYERSRALYRFDEKGERRFLSDEERAQAQQRMDDAVQKWCN